MIATNTSHEVSATTGILGKRKARPTTPRPGTRLYFLVRSHAPVWRVFRTSIVQGEGVILITGEAGVGKSLFLNRLKDVLPDNRDMVQILDPTVGANEFLQALMAAVKHGAKSGNDLPPLDPDITHKQLLDALEERVATGRRLLVAIDQAHMLSDANAELLSLLIPFSAKGMKPVQVLLVGRPELWGCLDSEPFRIIRKEIVGSGDLTPLTKSEVLDFIHFFIKKSIGRNIRVSWFAWVDIYSATQGNPFRIEQILTRTLALIKLKPRWIITRSLVKAAQQNDPELLGNTAFSNTTLFVFAVLALTVGVGYFSGLFDIGDKPQTFARIEIPSASQSAESAESAESTNGYDVIKPLETQNTQVTPTKIKEAVLPTTQPAIQRVPLDLGQRDNPTREEATSIVNRQVIVPTQAKAKKIIWNPKPRGREVIYSLPTPTVKPAQKVVRNYEPTPVAVNQPQKAVHNTIAAVSSPKPKRDTSQVKRIILYTPDVSPRKKGSFITLKSIKPRQVRKAMPVTSPLMVGSKEDRVFGEVVAKFQKEKPEETLSKAALFENTPLPLTTEETLKSAGKIYVVQIGSFLVRDNAERLMQTLSSQGMEPYVHLFKKGDENWFSVRLNHREQKSAEQMADTISKQMKMPARVIELFYE
ncbi:MAG: AAA family ATPase [Magnetococcales bacterium]|nr:AAA family ATPase [Magnetococcales bacterium]